MLLVLLIHTAIQWTIRAQHNLTPFGTASQSSRYVGSTPEGAILPPISNEFTLKTCSTTNVDGAPKAWWMFQFSFVSAFITDITIYYREAAHRMNGFKLYVTNTTTIPPDGFLCYDDPDPGLPNITQNIPCNQLGKYVIYYDTVGDVDTGPVVRKVRGGQIVPKHVHLYVLTNTVILKMVPAFGDVIPKDVLMEDVIYIPVFVLRVVYQDGSDNTVPVANVMIGVSTIA
ncbi:hypothetical protein AM593_04499, partial [Mytilus galloprovincialis]